MTVRLASPPDLDVVASLFDAYRQFYRQAPDLNLARRFMSERLEKADSVVFLATAPNGQAAGFAQLYPSFSSASAARIYILNDLYVAPEFRRQGVGALLLREAASFGRKSGAVRLGLSTEITNTTAQSLYEAEGWIRDSVFCHYTLNLTS